MAALWTPSSALRPELTQIKVASGGVGGEGCLQGRRIWREGPRRRAWSGGGGGGGECGDRGSGSLKGLCLQCCDDLVNLLIIDLGLLVPCQVRYYS